MMQHGMQERSLPRYLILQLINNLHLDSHLCCVFVVQPVHSVQMSDKRLDAVARNVAVRPFAEAVLEETVHRAKKFILFVVVVVLEMVVVTTVLVAAGTRSRR